jgi:hypothetical protein
MQYQDLFGLLEGDTSFFFLSFFFGCYPSNCLKPQTRTPPIKAKKIAA